MSVDDELRLRDLMEKSKKSGRMTKKERNDLAALLARKLAEVLNYSPD